MQLQRRPTLPAPTDLSRGLATCAQTLGQQPAVTVLAVEGRQEQGFVTLAQWAAKGSHLLQTDAQLRPGEVVFVDLPPSWQLAAVCAAVWWAGGCVATDSPQDAVAAVVHESREAPALEVCFVVGDAVDGGLTTTSPLLVWSEEVQLFPDAPPACAASADGHAIRDAAGTRTHAEVIASFTGQSDVLGVDAAQHMTAVAEVAARPSVTGRATVVLRGVERDAATGDRVARWA